MLALAKGQCFPDAVPVSRSKIHPPPIPPPKKKTRHYDWVNYSDLSRGHPKWWSSKGIPLQIPLNQVKDL